MTVFMGTSNADTVSLPGTGEMPGTGGVEARFTTTRRRWLQLGLAAIWVIDGLLQYQGYMFTKSFATQVLAPTAQGNPAWISDSILWAARIMEANQVSANAAFATLQLFIGLAIAYRRTLKPALVVSVIWSLLVWWFGEGLGGILVPGSSALMGAPGAALLYALLAILLWPTKEGAVGSFVAVKPVGRTAAKAVWVILWGGLAALNLEPANLTAQGVYVMVDGMGAGQPGWLAALINGFTHLAEHRGVPLTIIGTIILGLIGVGVFFPPPVLRAVVVAAIVVSAFIWVIGQALGGVFGGQGTDVNSGPLLAVIALAYQPPRLRARPNRPTEPPLQKIPT